jgi:CrcB protein
VKYLCVFIGGGIGAALRFLCSSGMSSVAGIWIVPAGTLLVNTAGALVIGFLASLFSSLAVPAELRLFLMTGFLGGFTTFSTYSLETVQYLQSGNLKSALMNILLNNILCFVFVFAGMQCAKIVK